MTNHWIMMEAWKLVGIGWIVALFFGAIGLVAGTILGATMAAGKRADNRKETRL